MKSNTFAAYQSVKVIDESMERHEQVGTVVGEDTEAGLVHVKFDDPEGGQVTEEYPVASLVGL